MKEAEAFSPCHITGFFEIFDQQADPMRNGSRGAGVSLKSGVETNVRVAEARQDSVEIRINDVRQRCVGVSRQVVRRLLARLHTSGHFRVDVEHRVSVPIGAGFGTSGAAALSLALALNKALGLELSATETAQVAHVAEVECKTGLGTVVAEAFGGVEIRVGPGGPGVAKVERLHVPKNTVVACLVFGPVSTRKTLMNKSTRDLINRWGGDLVDRLVAEPNMTGFLKCSREFAEHVGLISGRVRRVLDETDKAGFLCSMPMFGDSAFTLVESRALEGLLRAFERGNHGGVIVTSSIDFEGARMLK